MELRIKIENEAFAKKAEVVQRQVGNDLEASLYKQIQDHYRQIALETNSLYLTGQMTDEAYEEKMGEKPSQSLKESKSVADNNSKKLFQDLHEELFPFEELDYNQLRKGSLELIAKKTPIAQVYKSYLQSTEWTIEDYNKVLKIIKEKGTATIADLDIFPRKIKVFRLLETMIQFSDIVQIKEKFFRIADDHKLSEGSKEELVESKRTDLDESFTKANNIENAKRQIVYEYADFIEATYWTEEEMAELEKLFDDKKEIFIEDLAHYEDYDKLFRMIDYLKAEGKIYEQRQNVLVLIEDAEEVNQNE